MKRKSHPNKERMSSIDRSIEDLKLSVESISAEAMFSPDSLFPEANNLPGLNLEIEQHDYEADVKKIKKEAEETLSCLSGLYLDKKTTKNKNIYNIIKNNAETISDIKFSIECAKRGLISCMQQLDAGVNDPDMHVAVNTYQKEIRESNKMLYDLLNKMKNYYKELKEELITSKDINLGEENKKEKEEEVFIPDENDISVIDSKSMNEFIQKLKDDPDFKMNF
jgi:hypothetical protein